jgi:hypothetical protein
MFHLVYISHTSHPLQEQDLMDILTQSRLHNKKHHITGMLLYLNEKFIQVLEGNYEEVKNVYEKIKKRSTPSKSFYRAGGEHGAPYF